jgi:hypothetical protein
MTEQVPKIILISIEEVHSYASHVDEWIIIKKELLKSLPSNYRSMFSTRDAKTKKVSLNEFERQLVDIYYMRFDKQLKV